MRRLSAYAWRSVAERRGRSLLTIAGIALGVGVLVAALATNAGIASSVERTVAEIVGRADLRVSALGEAGLSDATLAEVVGTPGVAVAAPELEGRTYLQRGPADPPTGFEDPVTVLGVDPPSYEQVHGFSIVEGAAPTAADATGVLITERLRAATGLGPGSDLRLLGSAASGPVTLRVSGVVAGEGPLVASNGRTVIVPIETARELFGLGGATRVDLRVADDSAPATVAAALETRLTREPYILSTPADLAASLRASATDFQSMMALIAAVALFVGAFLIFNTLSMTVGERTREVGLLRAAGTTRRQVNGLIVLQALVLGVAGSAAGIALGYVIAAAMAAYVRSIEGIPLDRLEIPLPGIALAFGIGLLVTLAAAIEPAWRAGRISPVEALRARMDPSTGRRARLRWLVVVLAVVAIAGLIAWPREAPASGIARPLVVYAILLLGSLLTPFVLGPLGRVAGIPFAVLLPAEERLTRGALVRDRSRTALTLGALTVGLAMVVAIGGVALNAREAASAWLADVVPGDEVVTSIRPAGLDEGIQGELAAVEGVARVTPIATFEVAHDGIRLDAAAVVGADLLADGRLEVVSGDRAAALAALDAGGSIVLPRSQADRLGLAVGDTMSVVGGTGMPTDLRVAAIVERGLPGRSGETAFVGWPDATGRLGVLGADAFVVRFAPGQADRARPALESTARGLALEPSTLVEVEGAISNALGRVFGLFDVLALVAVIVAGLGIVNTLTMNVVERVREIGILRATGMTRRQVARMVVVEAGVLGIVGAIVGGVVGVAASAAMVGLASGGLLGEFHVPWVPLIGAALFGVAVAMAAAYQPARLASRVSIVRAVQFE